MKVETWNSFFQIGGIVLVLLGAGMSIGGYVTQKKIDAERALWMSKVEDRTKPRSLSADDRNKLASAMAKFAPQKLALIKYSTMPAESDDFIEAIAATLGEAGWTIERPSPLQSLPHTVSTRVFIDGDPNNPAQAPGAALVDALRALGVPTGFAPSSNLGAGLQLGPGKLGFFIGPQ